MGYKVALRRAWTCFLPSECGMKQLNGTSVS